MTANRLHEPADVAGLAGLAGLLRRSGITVECEVSGASMGRAVPAGATVRIRCDGAVGAPVGTVVAVLIGGALSVHRLVHRGRSARARGWIVSEGDANLTCDAPVRDADVVGVVDAVRLMAQSRVTGHGRLSDDEWQPVADASPRTWSRRWLASTVRRAISVGLEIDPRLARALKSLVVMAMTPFVLLRPYPAGLVRRASVAHRPGS